MWILIIYGAFLIEICYAILVSISDENMPHIDFTSTKNIKFKT